MSDYLIRRQDAIDALKKVLVSEELGYAIPVLEDLPSAQPEITVDHALTEEEIKNIKQKMADLPIVSMPSAQPEPQWIPCSERLPEANGRYLVTRGLNACGAMWNRVYLVNYSDLMGLKSDRIWWNGNVGKSDFEHIDDVIAWMPLPKPWEGEER